MDELLMPAFLEKKLKAEYPGKPLDAVYGTMNAIGAMRGNKETAKGRAMQAKHNNKLSVTKLLGKMRSGY